ncbi:hypothetical protein KEJ27_07845 [Candidatus Bathyarchaeota archaeon]|nr:hypothetical protein [Candidatus Bathyarchaeota archaeon]MBS7613345.1 hypothetical protein [Candidatus Bathyarchaeota archaeon]MBS7617869.1 hypothetical protein [Candidatus Bathyarchaeota archaeon]
MVVRVKVKLQSATGEVVTAALANSGFEADEPEVILPIKVAERLSIYPKLPIASQVEDYKAVGGVLVKTFLVRGFVKIKVLTDDRDVGPVDVTAVITPGEDEVILSDKLMDMLKIVLLKPGEGIWKFTDDEEGTTRESEHLEKW